MIVISAALIGAILGGLTARKHGGKPADMVQYAAVYAIGFAVVGVLVTIMVHRAAL
ncbi:hypothetical protein [Antarcticimicrobium luteum]|uniref:hypothetical protein n=1 Tax=Antarcticimicrobium luteum TaxID=2547397 RepID=UPI00140C8F32|nr:hypothetical protein [Antarcticimicrobium luteum]